jgi:hypothetical protein
MIPKSKPCKRFIPKFSFWDQDKARERHHKVTKGSQRAGNQLLINYRKFHGYLPGRNNFWYKDTPGYVSLIMDKFFTILNG